MYWPVVTEVVSYVYCCVSSNEYVVDVSVGVSGRVGIMLLTSYFMFPVIINPVSTIWKLAIRSFLPLCVIIVVGFSCVFSLGF